MTGQREQHESNRDSKHGAESEITIKQPESDLKTTTNKVTNTLTLRGESDVMLDINDL